MAVTVDLPLPGNRERDLRSGFEIDLGVHLPPEQPVDPDTGIVVLPTFDWAELEWLRGVCPLPLLVKGVLRADDAARAVELAATASGSATTAAASSTRRSPSRCPPEIAEAVGDRTLLVVDGGVAAGSTCSRGSRLARTSWRSAVPCCGAWPSTAPTASSA